MGNLGRVWFTIVGTDEWPLASGCLYTELNTRADRIAIVISASDWWNSRECAGGSRRRR
jgi:hypothetical protein